MPVDYRMLDTRLPERLGSLAGGIRQNIIASGGMRMPKDNSLSSLMQPPQQLAQADTGMEDLGNGIMVDKNGFVQQSPEQNASFDAWITNHQKMELEREKLDVERQKAQLPKLQFSAESGGFIEPPSAQNPQGRIIHVPGMKKNTSKPLPTAALKLQQEELDAIGSASALNADLGQFKSMVESGKLPLGMTSNWAAEAKNYTGMSDEGSRNYASFKANLERLRNESLRLNKGVQTEGDAVRAWNEIVKNINDPKLVAQRLGEVAKTNERAIQLRKMNVDAIRGNYGHDPMDVSARENLGSAYGDPTNQGGGYEQTATNPQTGQKIGLRNGQWEPIQ